MTEEQYLSLPEEKPYLEYVDGVVLQKPMPNAEHGVLVAEVIIELGLYRRSYGGSLGPERRVRLGDAGNYRLPDASYWAPGRPHGDDSIPTLAVEVRSPGQAMVELRQKCRVYRSAGVDLCWLFDPQTRTVEIFEGSRDADVLGPEERLESPQLPGLSLSPAALFAILDE
jgi:Uma2 family endonuclease